MVSGYPTFTSIPRVDGLSTDPPGFGASHQRFNAESFKVDIPDEKFAITAFIARLGVQSKDLMFSISKNPQASMAEVLAKAEKYINGEEALISKRGSSSAHKEKSEIDKRQGRSPKR